MKITSTSHKAQTLGCSAGIICMPPCRTRPAPARRLGADGNGSFLEAAWADEPRDAGPMQQSTDDHEDTYGDSKDTGDLR
jgi:hypothetical protein